MPHRHCAAELNAAGHHNNRHHSPSPGNRSYKRDHSLVSEQPWTIRPGEAKKGLRFSGDRTKMEPIADPGLSCFHQPTSVLSILPLFLLGTCTSQTPIPSPSLPTVTPVPETYVEIGYEDLQLRELGQDLLTDPGLPGCDLRDLPAFNWKLVDAGQVAIRTQEEYALHIDSLYAEGYAVFQENLAAFPDTYQSVPNYGGDEFLEICNVFP